MNIKELNEELGMALNETTVAEIEPLARDYFQPFMTFEEYKNENKTNAYMIWNTDLVYIGEGGSKEAILYCSSKKELKTCLLAIRKYEEEKQFGRNEQAQPPQLLTKLGTFKKK